MMWEDFVCIRQPQADSKQPHPERAGMHSDRCLKLHLQYPKHYLWCNTNRGNFQINLLVMKGESDDGFRGGGTRGRYILLPYP